MSAMKSIVPAWCCWLLLWALTVRVEAEKDSTYWPPGKTNPNVKKKMYWHDSFNVLQDIDQFDKLYVVYHNCA